jgi:hypothetical protein
LLLLAAAAPAAVPAAVVGFRSGGRPRATRRCCQSHRRASSCTEIINTSSLIS